MKRAAWIAVAAVFTMIAAAVYAGNDAAVDATSSPAEPLPAEQLTDPPAVPFTSCGEGCAHQ